MPQLDFANPLTISQVVWMFLIFGALYLLLARWALPRWASVIEAREQRILADLDSARIAKEQADAAAAEIAERSRAASAEAQAEIAKAVAAAKAEAAEKARADNEQLDRQLAEAEQRIGAARNQAMGALREVATEAAATVVTRLTGQPADPARVDAAVGQRHDRPGGIGAAPMEHHESLFGRSAHLGRHRLRHLLPHLRPQSLGGDHVHARQAGQRHPGRARRSLPPAGARPR